MRRRIRLRTTAPPSARLMLKPKRLCGNSFAFINTVKWELERRFPLRYTASKSALRANFPVANFPVEDGRTLSEYSCPVLLGRKAMASLLAACRKNFPAAYGLHA